MPKFNTDKRCPICGSAQFLSFKRMVGKNKGKVETIRICTEDCPNDRSYPG